jgi:hypothetical protein
MSRSIVIAPTLLLALAPLLVAQSPAKWDRVKQLVAGTEVRITLMDGRNLLGTFQSATDDALMFGTSNSQEALSRTMVARVSSRGTSHRLRNALIGLGAGAGGGLAVGAVLDANSCKNPALIFGCLQPVGNNFGKLVLTPLGGLAGGIVGAFLPTGGWNDVYRAR